MLLVVSKKNKYVFNNLRNLVLFTEFFFLYRLVLANQYLFAAATEPSLKLLNLHWCSGQIYYLGKNLEKNSASV